MTWTRERNDNQLWSQFSFYDSYGADGASVLSLNTGEGSIWRLGEVRIHTSVAHVSVEDLTIRLSAAQGRPHDLMFVSQAFLTVQDYVYMPDKDYYFLSDDEVIISLSLASGTNVITVNVQGWATNS